MLDAGGGRPGEELRALLSIPRLISRPAFEGSDSASDCLGGVKEFCREEVAPKVGDFMAGELDERGGAASINAPLCVGRVCGAVGEAMGPRVEPLRPPADGAPGLFTRLGVVAALPERDEDGFGKEEMLVFR